MSKSKSKAADKSVRATQIPRWLGRDVTASSEEDGTILFTDLIPLFISSDHSRFGCSEEAWIAPTLTVKLCLGQVVKHHILCRYSQHHLILHTQCSTCSKIRCGEGRKGRSREQDKYSSGAVGRNRNSDSRLTCSQARCSRTALKWEGDLECHCSGSLCAEAGIVNAFKLINGRGASNWYAKLIRVPNAGLAPQATGGDWHDTPPQVSGTPVHTCALFDSVVQTVDGDKHA